MGKARDPTLDEHLKWGTLVTHFRDNDTHTHTPDKISFCYHMLTCEAFSRTKGSQLPLSGAVLILKINCSLSRQKLSACLESRDSDDAYNSEGSKEQQKTQKITSDVGR